MAISTQEKGGAGKTTLDGAVASYLHYVERLNVAIVELRFPQYSIHDMRKRDMKAVMEDGHTEVISVSSNSNELKNPYTIQMQPCGRCGKDCRKSGGSAARPRFRVLRPAGNNQQCRCGADHFQNGLHLHAHHRDRVVMESSIHSATVINEQMISTGKSGIKGIYLVGTCVDGREETELYKAYDKVCAEFALSILEHIYRTASVSARSRRQQRKAVFRSTAFPADKILVRGSNLDKLVDEIFGIIKN